jgi:hypothetical protein
MIKIKSCNLIFLYFPLKVINYNLFNKTDISQKEQVNTSLVLKLRSYCCLYLEGLGSSTIYISLKWKTEEKNVIG